MKLKELNHAEAKAQKQTELTQTLIEVEISGNKGEAQLAEARRLAERDVVRANGESRSRELLGKGEAARVGKVGLAEAAVFLKKIQAYGDPRLFALNLLGEKVAGSRQPLVPERLFMLGGKGNGEMEAGANGLGMFGYLIALLLAEKTGLNLNMEEVKDLEDFAKELASKAEDQDPSNVSTEGSEGESSSGG